MKLFILLITILFTQQILAQDSLLKYTVTIYDSIQSKGYYFLFTYKMRKRDAPGNNQQMILDGTGHLIYYRLTPKASDFKLHSNGMMSYFGENKFMLMDSTFSVVDSIGCVNGIETDNHDFIILPNGNYLLIGTKNREADLSVYPIFMQKNLPGRKKAVLKYGIVQELDKNKKLIYQWDSEPYFKIEDVDKIYLNDTSSLDVTHFNSVEKDKDGNIIVSARYSNEVIKINVKDGTLLWRMGGRHNQFTFINDSLPFVGQHDARIQANNNFTLFDNGYGKEHVKHNARAIEYKLDEQNKTATLIWYYNNENKIISEATGNAQRLTNGNTLINYGKIANGTPNITFEVVKPNKQKIYSLSFADTVGTYRAFYYEKLPFKLNQPKIKVEYKKDKYILTVENTYSSYQWNTKEQNQSITVTNPGKYYVYVPYGNDGKISSIPIIFTDTDFKK